MSGSVYDGLPDLHAILVTAAEIARAMEYLHSKNVLYGTQRRKPAQSGHEKSAVT